MPRKGPLPSAPYRRTRLRSPCFVKLVNKILQLARSPAERIVYGALEGVTTQDR